MWKDIEEINWSELCRTSRRPYEEGKRYMLENFAPARCKKIDDFVRERFTELYRVVNHYEAEHNCTVGMYGGDDSFGDMLHHVIGCGEEVFNAIMEDPTGLDYVHYVESFSYCLPYKEDFEMLKDGYFEDKAKMCIYELARILKENDPDSDDVKIILELMKRFSHMVAGNFKEATDGFTRNHYSMYYNFEANDQHAMFANILSDCEKFKV